jgi:hypothetical protein
MLFLPVFLLFPPENIFPEESGITAAFAYAHAPTLRGMLFRGSFATSRTTGRWMGAVANIDNQGYFDTLYR